MKVLDSIREPLSAYQQDNLEIHEKDLIRRKHMYFKGFFLPLRRAALQDFSEELQLKLLDLAEQDLTKISGFPVYQATAMVLRRVSFAVQLGVARNVILCRAVHEE